ncbi:polysaccharide biosynthesis/export family protein [Parvularcula marina]|uniref:polysaccharide biosynthesis/export family protein n=1 Tax=Parvularcula marina TaxID=2292771 RepID=UPI0035126034
MRTFLLSALALFLGSAAQAQTQGYELGPNDQIEVMIYGQTEEPLALRVTERGTVTLPLIGAVEADGQSPLQFAERVAQKMKAGGYLKDPIVNVEVLSYQSKAATVLGAVEKPGLLPIIGPEPLSRLLAKAGGVRAGHEIVVLRRPGEAVRTLSMSDVASGAADPVVQPGDVIHVPAPRRFFIYGQVQSPGSYAITEKMTLRQALAFGGGPSNAGSERGLKLYRGGQERSVGDLEAAVQDGDVIFVPERFF